MKNNLLISTALVAAIFTASNVMADDFRQTNVPGNDDGYVRYVGSGTIDADDTGHIKDSGVDRIAFQGHDATITLANDVTFGNYVTFNDNTTIDGNKTLTLTGYLTQDNDGGAEYPDLSGIDLAFQTGTLTEEAGTTYDDGGIILGSGMTVGNVDMAQGTGIGMFNVGTEYELITTAGKTVTLNGNNNIRGFDGKHMTINGAGTVDNKGTLTIKRNTTIGTGVTLINRGTIDNATTPATLNFADGSNYQFAVNSAADYAQIKGNVGLDGTVALNPIIATGIADDTDIDFIDGTVSGTGAFDLADNNIYNTVLNGDNNSINISKKGADEIASTLGANGNQMAAGGAIITGGTSGNAGFDDVAGNINTLLQSSNPDDVKAGLKMVDQLSSDTSSSAQSNSVAGTGAVLGAVGTRMSGGNVTTSQGTSSGDVFEKAAVWAQALVNKSKLDKTDGFDADSTGVALGLEKEISDSTKVGLGYAYTNTDIDTDSRKTDVDTHTAFVYGEYKPSQWFLNGIASYSWGDYDEKNAVKSAKYDVNSIALQAMTGYDFLMNSTVLTPMAGLRYINVDQKSYTDSLGSRVAGNKSDILTGVAGVKVAKDFALKNGVILKPEAKVALTYDLVNDDASSVITLANSSSYAASGKALNKFGQEVGAGLTASFDNIDVTLGYEGKFRQDYSDHTGLLNAKYNF